VAEWYTQAVQTRWSKDIRVRLSSRLRPTIPIGRGRGLKILSVRVRPPGGLRARRLTVKATVLYTVYEGSTPSGRTLIATRIEYGHVAEWLRRVVATHEIPVQFRTCPLSRDRRTMDEVEEYIAYLVDEGGLIFQGMDENGEAIYHHNMDILEQIAPEYAAEHRRDIEDTLISLYQKGLVDIVIGDDGEAKYKLAGVDDDLKLW
jgi:hypothetical protein